jgi:phenylacetate-CoA ligase
MSKFIQRLRLQLFWATDRLQGGHVKDHLTQIENIIGKGNQVEKLSNQNALLKHAVSTVKFYEQFKNAQSIEEFPVINKSLIRERFHEFISRNYREEELVRIVTSGSTGTPFLVLHDRNKRFRNSADTIYFASKAGFSIGDKLIYLKIWSSNNMKSRLQFFLQNMVPVDVITLNDQQIAGLLKKMEKDKSSLGMLGYSSALELICKYIDKNNLKIQRDVKSVLAMSESLNEYTKTSFQKYFGVPALSRYSNLENGIIAQQTLADPQRFLVNTASYVVEILDFKSDTKVPEGELGRIVVTDLFNYGMPQVRYDTGDIGALSKDDRANTYLQRVEGRKLDLLYATNGDLVSSFIVYKNMWKYTEINQYQLIQEGERDYRIKINVDGVFNKESELISEFQQYLGQDASFKIEFVDEIPLLSSGKRKKIVNTFHPSIQA